MKFECFSFVFVDYSVNFVVNNIDRTEDKKFLDRTSQTVATEHTLNACAIFGQSITIAK